MCSNVVWRSLESLGIVWGSLDCLLVPVVVHQAHANNAWLSEFWLLRISDIVSAFCACLKCQNDLCETNRRRCSARWRRTHLQT